MSEQKYITDTQDKFEILSESVEKSITEIEKISKMTNDLTVAKDSVANACTDLGAISEELGASTQEVSSSCQSVATSCADTRACTEEMNAINSNLVESVSFFKL